MFASITACSALAAAVWLSAGEATSAEMSSRYSQVSSCREVVSSVEPDWVQKRCSGYRGQSVWIAYSDSTKSHVGFGPKENVSGIFAAEGVETATLEWRGSLIGMKFEPFAVITRVRRPFTEEKESFLVIYRLRRDGTSCIVGTAGSNATAREIADASLKRYECEEQPQVP